MTSALLLLALATGETELLQRLVQLQLEDQPQEALQVVRDEMREDPDRAREMGLHYLYGHLLDQLNRHEHAADAFAQTMGLDPRLTLHARYRAALKHEEMGHPEMAAGLIATVVSSESSPTPLKRRAVRLFVRTLDAGGDCRLLGNVDPSRLEPPERRHIHLVQGNCELRAGTRDSRLRARDIYLELLREDVQDEPQREAAEQLSRLIPAQAARLDVRNPRLSDATLIGLAFYQHRDFEAAYRYLSRAAVIFGDSLNEAEFDLSYARIRSLFWQELFDRAAQGYYWLATESAEGESQAKAFYQSGRSLELAGRWQQAQAVFRAAFRADPDGSWADPALFSLLRILWITGSEEEGEKIFEHLLTQRSWRGTAARAALFLAASDLVRERSDRAGAWLDEAARVSEARLEAEYWRGRLAQLENRNADAIGHYLAALRRDLYHPLAQSALARLRTPPLDALARTRGLAASRIDRNDRLYEAWLLLGPDSPTGQEALQHLRRHLKMDRTAAPFLDLQPLPVQRWPLWEKNLQGSEDRLLALGDLGLSGHRVEDHFPLQNVELGYTGSNLLAIAEQTQDSIRLAEILVQRLPRDFPEPLLPGSFRRLLYPLAHRELLLHEGRRRQVDPLLLAAIIREESRFDAEALSAASARGLTQFVQPTAQRIAAKIGMGPIEPEDLYRPEVAIPLGAAYLQELLERFGHSRESAVTSYNAGEPQAEIWRKYCLSSEEEEYFTKVGFRETRKYLERVLGSYARYRELYGGIGLASDLEADSPAVP